MKNNIILWSLVPILSTLYQLSTKLVAHGMDGMDFGVSWLAQASTTPWMWVALTSELAAFVIWMRILSDHDLSKAFPLTAISYLLILSVSWFGFHETIVPLQLVGGALILSGVWMIGTANTPKKAAA